MKTTLTALLSGLALLAGGCEVAKDLVSEPTGPDAGVQRDAAPACTPECAPGERRCEGAQIDICADGDGDGCGDWGRPIECPAGTACTEGACAALCQHACSDGESICSAAGVRRCEAGADGCRALAVTTPCAQGERCDDGACVPTERPCEDGCPDDGARECVADGYRTCGQFDEDACREWSVTVACDPGDGCANGECVPECTDGCAPGERRCQDGGVVSCGNFDDDVCLELGAPTPCGDDERCDEGACVPAGDPCEPACESEGDQICEGAGFRRCGQYDEDACLDLSAVVACGARERCEAGQCVPACADDCAAGPARCQGAATQTCGNFDADPCLEWGAAVACDDGEICDNGACVPDQEPCVDGCEAGARRCAGASVEICGNHDDDACVEWGGAPPCANGERCEDGACVSDCVDECAVGERVCRGGGVASCGEHDADPCRELGPPEACPAGESCVDGACQAQCVDECAVGARRCNAQGQVERCGPSQLDACRHWSSPVPCGAREACREGECAVVCQDECAPGERRCLGEGFEICGDFDADACVEFGGGAACGPQEVCEDGACNSACEDECPAEGARDCADADHWRSCGNFDADPCLEWAQPDACGAGLDCDAGACVPTPPPAGVLLNEVYYDAPAGDMPWVFIELWGPAGTALDGLRLVGVNGAGGADYVVMVLAGVIPADGYFVIARPDADETLLAVADQLHGGADLQNGPDNVQLRWGDVVVDALGYGDFADATFAGEGQPAPDVTAQSLGRDAAHTDTDDNAADFTPMEPSPGAAAPGG